MVGVYVPPVPFAGDVVSGGQKSAPRALDTYVYSCGPDYWRYPKRIPANDVDAITPVLPQIAEVEAAVNRLNDALSVAGFVHFFDLRLQVPMSARPRHNDAATLDELREVLKAYADDNPCGLFIHNPHSYRGSYDCFGFEYGEKESTVAEMKAALTGISDVYCGWKGGEYGLDGNSFCYLAAEGSSGVPFSVALLRKYLGEG